MAWATNIFPSANVYDPYDVYDTSSSTNIGVSANVLKSDPPSATITAVTWMNRTTSRNVNIYALVVRHARHWQENTLKVGAYRSRLYVTKLPVTRAPRLSAVRREGQLSSSTSV